ncbi:MAG: Coenzyme F420 hydrogenase/dehydrogenase, beta subunit C-terminal domain [Promethearchaeota archaeon]
MEIKIFSDLINEVHNKGICQLCGGCVSFCSSFEDNIIDFVDLNSPPQYINEEKCLKCGICYYICPQTHVLDETINKIYKFSDFTSMPLGYYEQIYTCQSTDGEFLKIGIDGGVVNSIINFLIEKKVIDGAIVAKTTAPFSRESFIAYNKKDLINASGIKLDISQQLKEAQRLSTYTKSISKLTQYKFKKLALVGTPCQIYTIRCMQDLEIIPSENIELCLGLFCYESFSFDKTKIRQFEKNFNIKFKDITKINIKENVILKLKDTIQGEKILTIPFNQLTDYMRPSCNSCRDFTNIYADISFGGLGSHEKYTTVIPRTDKGKKFLRKVVDGGGIKCLTLDAQRKKNMIILITEYSKKKFKRYDNFFKSLS